MEDPYNLTKVARCTKGSYDTPDGHSARSWVWIVSSVPHTEVFMKYRLRTVSTVCFLVLCGFFVSAQSNDLVDKILIEESLTARYAAYLALAGADVVAADASPEEALTAALERGWIEGAPGPADAVTLGTFAQLVVQAFEIPSGLMYRLLPGPRYAARELAFREMIVGSTSPYRSLSGEEALGILGAVLDWREGGA
jgi:hypothetical protein